MSFSYSSSVMTVAFIDAFEMALTSSIDGLDSEKDCSNRFWAFSSRVFINSLSIAVLLSFVLGCGNSLYDNYRGEYFKSKEEGKLVGKKKKEKNKKNETASDGKQSRSEKAFLLAAEMVKAQYRV